MIKSLQSFFDRHLSDADNLEPEFPERRLRLATAALFVEMIRADFEVTGTERASLESEVREALELDAQEARELIELAEKEAGESIELFQFTRLIDADYDPQQKVELVERLWRLAFSDARIDTHEEHLVRKVANLLHVSHKEFISAKQRARAALS
ncbi:MAG: TerB family tellurite resistance protein [Acidobacteriota bacterium]|nr:TerB family tellurite resistance protein [Acidobacteriota bacterium]